MLYLRLTYYQAQNYITLKPSSDSIFRRFCVIFDLAPVTHGTTRTINSLLIFMKSHPTMVRIEPPSLLESVTGRKYHYIPAFIALQRAAPHSETSYLSQAYGFSGCRILVRRRINVSLLLLFFFQATVQERYLPYII